MTNTTLVLAFLLPLILHPLVIRHSSFVIQDNRQTLIDERFSRAVELQRRGDLKEAEAEYRALLTLAPNYAEAHANLGAVLMRLDRYEEAISYYESALRLAPGLVPVWLNLGIAHYRKAEYEKAVGALKHFLERSPNNTQALQLTGLSLVELGRHSEAVEFLRQALSQAPDDAAVLYGLGLAYLRLKDPALSGIIERLRKVPGGETAAGLLQGTQNNFIGAAGCTPCHRPQAEKQLASNMAKAAFRPSQHPLFEQFRNEAARILGLRFLFLWKGNEFQISISDEKEELRFPAQWALGAGVHGVTFLSRLEKGKYLEYLLSYYTHTGRLDFTPGQGERPFQSLAEARGQPNTRAEAFHCLSCHTTGSGNPAEAEDISVGELGVRCEACHGPGLLHVEAVKQQNWEEARKQVQNPRRYTARQVLELCGTCHREPPTDPARVNWTDPANTRFQPVGLSQSRCYLKSDGKLSCLTCHDSHSDVRRDNPGFYSAICASCHTAARNPPASICSAEKSPDCIRCHMPKVQAIRHMEFSNHWIGIFRDSNKLVPARKN